MGWLEIAKLVWPLALGMLNNAVLQFVDRAFLARESMESLEAALPASMLALTVAGFFQAIVAYSGTFVAQYHGAGDSRGERMAFRAGMLIAVASGIIAAALVPAGRVAVSHISENAAVVSRALNYYSIVSCGTIALCAQMATASYFTGRGRTGSVLLVSVCGNLLNVFLDWLLIFRFGLGISGAAYATVAAMAAQWAALATLAKCERGEDAPANLRTTGEITLPRLAGRILRYGVPSGVYSVLNGLSFTIFVFATGRVGDVEFAVSNACFSINWLLIAPMEGFAIGASTLVAQAQGRGDSALARTALRRTLILALAVVAALSAAAVAFHHPILSLFAPEDAARAADFHSLGFKLVLLMAAWQLFDAADVVISGALKGAGDTKFVMLWMVATAFGFWLPLVFIVLAAVGSMASLWATMVAYVVVICAGEIVRWRRGRWQAIKLV